MFIFLSIFIAMIRSAERKIKNLSDANDEKPIYPPDSSVSVANTLSNGLISANHNVGDELTNCGENTIVDKKINAADSQLYEAEIRNSTIGSDIKDAKADENLKKEPKFIKTQTRDEPEASDATPNEDNSALNNLIKHLPPHLINMLDQKTLEEASKKFSEAIKPFMQPQCVDSDVTGIKDQITNQDKRKDKAKKTNKVSFSDANSDGKTCNGCQENLPVGNAEPSPVLKFDGFQWRINSDIVKNSLPVSSENPKPEGVKVDKVEMQKQSEKDKNAINPNLLKHMFDVHTHDSLLETIRPGNAHSMFGRTYYNYNNGAPSAVINFNFQYFKNTTGSE